MNGMRNIGMAGAMELSASGARNVGMQEVGDGVRNIRSEYRFNLLVEYQGSDKGVPFLTAYDTETYDGAPDGGGIMGFGSSPRAAIDSLMDLLWEEEEENEHRDRMPAV